VKKAKKYYKHSGAIGFFSPFLMFIFGAVSVALLSVAYGYAIHYIPLIYFNFFITLFFGAGVGFSIAYAARLGKCRNVGMVLLIGFSFGVAAAYAGWITWFYAASDQKLIMVMPDAVWTATQRIAETGHWSLFKWTPKNDVLNIIWGVEAAMIILTCTGISVTQLDTPFCERCKKWMDKEEKLQPLDPIVDSERVVLQFENGDYSALAALQKVGPGANLYTQVTLNNCDFCGNGHLMTVESVVASTDSGGNLKTSETPIVSDLRISPNNFNYFLSSDKM